jgi:hypothetical protein
VNDLEKKFTVDQADSAINFFVKEGFVLLKDVHDESLVSEVQEYIWKNLNVLINLSKQKKIPLDLNGYAVAIIKKFETTNIHERFTQNKKYGDFLVRLLGNDICILGQDALWLNYPADKDPVLNKNTHTDAWTGTSVNTLISKFFVTDVDEHNGIYVVPGSHLWGLVPSRNRSVDPACNLTEHIQEVNLKKAKAGDVLLWHSLLLHGTVGHSDKNIRISMTSRYSSTETPFSSQERALGYKPLRVGPMNQILRLIGNDLLSPFRTLGGYVGIDRRLQDLYGYSNYEAEIDYSEYLI